jgi:hypothetical protein
MKFASAWLPIDVDQLSRETMVKMIVDWLQGRGAYDYDEYTSKPPENCILNVAGNRESTADGMQDLVLAVIVDVLREVNPECRNFYPVAG